MSEEKKNYAVNDKRGQEKEASHHASDTVNSNQNFEQKKSESPTINFTSFILSISTSALVQMGLVPDPISKQTQKNLLLAKQQIDIIEMLSEKSKGNLDESEQKLIDQVLYELRMRYVEVQNNS